MADIRRNLGLPSGVVFPFAGVTAPYGYVICDGSAVLRTEYAALFAAIGTSHGSGDGTTTFNLPDYRGRFLRGVDGTAGADPDKAGRTAMNAGGATGNTVGSVQGDVHGSHTHIQNAHNHGQDAHQHLTGDTYNSAPYGEVGGQPGHMVAESGYYGSSGVGEYTTAAQPGIWNNTATNQNSGGNETRPKNANVNYIIKI